MWFWGFAAARAWDTGPPSFLRLLVPRPRGPSCGGSETWKGQVRCSLGVPHSSLPAASRTLSSQHAQAGLLMPPAAPAGSPVPEPVPEAPTCTASAVPVALLGSGGQTGLCCQRPRPWGSLAGVYTGLRDQPGVLVRTVFPQSPQTLRAFESRWVDLLFLLQIGLAHPWVESGGRGSEDI